MKRNKKTNLGLKTMNNNFSNHDHKRIRKFFKKCGSYKKTMERFNISSDGTLSYILNKAQGKKRSNPLNLKKERIDPYIIIDAVESVTGHNPLENTDTRKRPFVEIRQLTMYCIREFTYTSSGKIGNLFNKDHATVLHAVKTMDNLINFQKDKVFTYFFLKVEEISYREHAKQELGFHLVETLPNDFDELKAMNAELVYNANYLIEIIDKLPTLLRERFITDEKFIYTIKQKNTDLAMVQKPERFSSLRSLFAEGEPQGQQVRGEDNS